MIQESREAEHRERRGRLDDEGGLARVPIGPHCWYRHRAVDHDDIFEDTIMTALTDWAKEHGYDPGEW
jgi:hypothetical protein